MSAAAGWYADPTDAASVRYWDGTAWTAHTRPAPRGLVPATAETVTSVISALTSQTRASGITVSDGIVASQDERPSAPAVVEVAPVATVAGTAAGAAPAPAPSLLFTPSAVAAPADSGLSSLVVSAPAATEPPRPEGVTPDRDVASTPAPATVATPTAPSAVATAPAVDQPAAVDPAVTASGTAAAAPAAMQPAAVPVPPAVERAAAVTPTPAPVAATAEQEPAASAPTVQPAAAAAVVEPPAATAPSAPVVEQPAATAPVAPVAQPTVAASAAVAVVEQPAATAPAAPVVAQPTVAAPVAPVVERPAATPRPVFEQPAAAASTPEPVVAPATVSVPAVAAVTVAAVTAPVSNASVLATVDDSVPVPTLAPAPVAPRSVVSPSVVAPQAAAPAPAPAAAPAAGLQAQHMAASSVALLERPTAEPYVDSYTPPAPAAARGGFGGGATPSVFGGAPSTHGSGQGGFGSFAGDSSSASAAYRPERHLGRTLVILALVLIVLAVGGVIGIPRYLDSKAAAAAAEQPTVLTHSAPATLAGQRRLGGQVAQNSAVTAQMKSSGSAWAWAATYGTKSNATAYVAFDIPVSQRPQAYRAITNHGQAMTLVNDLGTKIGTASGGSELLGQATEFASPVGGKVWCMPVTINGNAGGMCLWTNGKEGLASVALPGVMDSAAKNTLIALGQLGSLTTRR